MGVILMLGLVIVCVLGYIMGCLGLGVLGIGSMRVFRLFLRLSSPRKYIMEVIKMGLFLNPFARIMVMLLNQNHQRC